MSVVMPLSNIVRKFAPRREQVVYNMVRVVHDALEKCIINGCTDDLLVQEVGAHHTTVA